MCLAAIGDSNFTPLIYRNCTDGSSNQEFLLEKNGRLSGQIHAQRDSNYCLQMADPNPLTEYLPVYLHSDCSDTWEVLDGRLKNTQRRKCLGREEESLRVVGVDCDSSVVENLSAFGSQYRLYNLHFKTASTTISAASSDPNSFEIDGYGFLPHECHNAINSECDLQLYGMKTFTMRALTTDTWAFTINGDIGKLLSYETAVDGKHYDPFPAVMDTDSADVEQTYALEMNHAVTECCFVHFKTLVASSDIVGNFFIDGYGHIPNECYSKQGVDCDIEICGRRTLVMRSFTKDQWQFEISGDVGPLYDYKTVTGGTHYETIAAMNIDEYDYLRVYELIPYSCCDGKWIVGDRGCCSWDGGYTCGDTTPYCRDWKEHCEGDCDGKWIAEGVGGSPAPSAPTPTPPTGDGSRCGCSTCTSTVLNRDANGHKVSARIDWLEANRGMSERQACSAVCGREFPNVCGECNPDSWSCGPGP